MIPGWLSEAADYFWTMAGPPQASPRDLTSAAPRGFVVDQQIILGLCIDGIQRWFARRQCDVRFPEPDRGLRGCLTAVGGSAIIFIDGADGAAEHRFTFAHEIAHFLLDYRLPRDRAVKLLGPSILEVLDGIRRPTEAERLDAAINACPLGLHYHLLDRRERTGHVSAVESKADQLACELLAPDEELELRFGSRHLSVVELSHELVQVFGLPLSEATRYSTKWTRARQGPSPLVRIV
ncbi:MAG: ImmA/IrrE family metallo-endopeptidase [Thermomicrobiales bacterium]